VLPVRSAVRDLAVNLADALRRRAFLRTSDRTAASQSSDGRPTVVAKRDDTLKPEVDADPDGRAQME